VGGTLSTISLSLRYQYLGKTADFEGVKDTGILRSNSEPVSLVLFRLSYRIGLDKYFKNKKSNTK